MVMKENHEKVSKMQTQGLVPKFMSQTDCSGRVRAWHELIALAYYYSTIFKRKTQKQHISPSS